LTELDKEELISRMNALVVGTDGTLTNSLIARLWVNKCIQIVENYD